MGNYSLKQINNPGLFMNRNKWIVTFIFITIAISGVIASAYFDISLLSKLPWLLILSAVTGIILGIVRSRFKDESRIENGEISRHGIDAFIEHWMTGLGILLLIISGFMIGFLFFPHFADTPKSVLFPLNLHFSGLIITFFGGFYFLTEHILSGKLKLLIPGFKDILKVILGKYIFKEKGNSEGKYLSSQKSAFLTYAILGGVQLITGSIKVIGHFWNIPSTTLALVTSIHDIFSLLFIIMLIVHILLVILSAEHRILLRSWVTGKVSETYAKEKHEAWYKEIKSVSNLNKMTDLGDSDEN
jgi:formate dehydrogenase gamma subunit